MSVDDPFNEEMVDPFSETIEEHVEFIPLCRCGSTPRSNDDVDRWKAEHLACYAERRKRDKEFLEARTKAEIESVKRKGSPERPGAITVYVIEACPFAHKVKFGVTIVSQPPDFYYFMCGDCSTEGPVGETDSKARELWNARRKV